MGQPKPNSQKPIIHGEARVLIAQLIVQLGNQGNSAVGPGVSTAGHLPIFSGTDGRTLSDPAAAFYGDDGTTVALVTDSARQLFFRASNLIKIQSQTQNAQVDAAAGKSVILSANGVTLLAALAGFINFQGNAIQNVILPVYANNAAAITGGLGVGDFYRTGANPDFVAVVH